MSLHLVLAGRPLRSRRNPLCSGTCALYESHARRKAKNDQIDSQKIATLLRGRMLPQPYGYPAEMRATRDLLRRRTHLMRKRAELLVHVQNTNSQYNLPEIGKKMAYKAHREGVAARVDDPAVHKTMEGRPRSDHLL